jgi:hypothetical protein
MQFSKNFLKSNGGDEETRTPDPLLARQVLSQLSYTPKNRCRMSDVGGLSLVETGRPVSSIILTSYF